MFRPIALYIGLRYTRAKRRNHFISFISLISMLGIALGVMVLITVLSVMNGFDYEIHNRIFSLTRQVTISGADGAISAWNDVRQVALKNSNVVAAAPFVTGQGMLTSADGVTGVMINGVLPELEKSVSNIENLVQTGSMSALKPGQYGIVLGWDIAANLGVTVGDKVMLVTPTAAITPVGVVPRFKRFTVAGVFRVGEGFGYDATTAFTHLTDAQTLYQRGNVVDGVNLKIKDLNGVPKVTHELQQQLPEMYRVRNWTDDYGAYFQAIKMEKTTMFVVLMFIIAVAVFNLVSSLVMTVTDKQADIAILRTVGVTPRTIMAIFVIHGGVIGAVGTVLGVLGGIVLALNAPHLVKMLESLFHTHFISGAIYFIDYLPSKLVLRDVVVVGLAAFGMSLLATIYPAWRAARTQPAEALRYE